MDGSIGELFSIPWQLRAEFISQRRVIETERIQVSESCAREMLNLIAASNSLTDSKQFVPGKRIYTSKQTTNISGTSCVRRRGKAMELTVVVPNPPCGNALRKERESWGQHISIQ